MSIQQKILQSQGLTDYETHIVDSLPTSKYFKVFSLDDTIPGGRSTFQILGSEFLENDVEIKIELIDVNGNPVYTEPIKYLGDDPSRHIMIEVYPTTATGVGTLTILGSLIDVPPEWKNVYNVKWEKEVFIDPVAKNIQPIFFRGEGIDFIRNERYPLPAIEIIETVAGVVVASGSGGDSFVTSSTFSGGDYDGNASPFARPMNIGDLKTNIDSDDAMVGDIPPTDIGHRGLGGGQTAKTTYAAKPKNQQNTTDTTAIQTNIVEQKYEEFHRPQEEPSPPPTPPIPAIASKPTPPIAVETKQPAAVGKGTLIKRQSGEPFRLELAGGTFKATPAVSPLVQGITGQEFKSSSYTASIVAVHSPDLLEVDFPFVVRDDTPEKDDSNPFIPVPHTGSSFTIDYEPVTTGSVSETILQSFAEITIKNMRTFSGDVHRIKTFAKGFSTQGDFKLVSDKLVEASDVLINTGSVSLSQKIGKFVNQIHIENNWQTKHIRRGTNVSTTSGTGSMAFSSTTSPPLMNAVLISGSNWKADESIVFETTTPKIKLRPNVDYNLSVNAILKTGEKDIHKDEGIVESQSRAKVRFYVSGSKLSQDLKGLKVASTGSIGNYLGDPIKVIQTEDESQGEIITLESDDNELGKNIDFGRVNIPFRPEFSGSGVTINDDTKLQVEVEAGQLYIQSIELTPATDTNFNPDEFRFVAPMPKLRKRPDLFDFLIEFYDRDGNKAQFTTIREAIEFDGENDVIQGTNNLLTGSLSIGNALGAGIEAAGVNSAYIRSVDYAGFNSSSVSGRGGFVMWSGSISRSLNTSESYDGVGIELHDGNSGSFKFRTLNADGVGEFDVRTNKFFFGKEGVQFVSGSDDQIEISSSNFHLQPDGNLTIGGGAKISASLTANQILVPANASTTGEASASISSTGAAKFVSASIGGFNVSETAISSSNDALILKSDGTITGSKFKLTGGTISENVTISGSFAANSVSLPAVGTPLAIITSDGAASFTSASIGGFNITSTEISSSNGKLILKATGQITASTIQLTGSLQAQDTDGIVYDTGDVFKRVNDTTGSLKTDVSSSVSKSIEIELETSSSVTSHSLVRTSLTSSKEESDLVAKGFGESAVVSASNEVTSSLTASLLFATSSLTSSLVFTSESLEFTRGATGSLESGISSSVSGGMVTALGFSSNTEASASATFAQVTTSLNTTITGSFVPVKADLTQSKFEVGTLQTESTSSRTSLASSITQLTSSLSESRAIMVSSSAFIDFAATGSQDFAHIVSGSVMTSASVGIDFAATGSQTKALDFAVNANTSASANTASLLTASSSLSVASQSIVAEFSDSASLLKENFSSVSQSALTFAINANISASAATASLLTASSSMSAASKSLSDASASAALASASMAVQVSLEDDGLEIYNNSSTLLAKYGSKTELFAGGNTANKAILDTSGLALVSGSVTGAFFGGTTTIGPESSTKSRVEISAGSVKIMHHTQSILTFDDSGDVTSESGFILERTRLFGAGGDGVITLKSNTATVSTGSGLNGAGKADDNATVVNEQGTTVLTRVGTVWSLRGDLYADSLELDNSTGTAPTLITSGSRIFVKNEFKIDTSCIVHNDGTAGEDGAGTSTSDNSTGDSPTRGGAGGWGNALPSGSEGQSGSRGGNPGSGGTYYGANGGGSGGSGGIIFISARLLVNSGSIRSLGGDGGDGGAGKGSLPGAGSGPAAGGAGSAGSVINIKV